MAKEVRGPVEQMLSVVLAGFEPSGRPHHAQPFADAVPRFFDYLVEERGLRPASVVSYRHHLDRFEAYLTRVGAGVHELSPALLSAFVTERAGAGLAKTTVREGCGVLRVSPRYAQPRGCVGPGSLRHCGVAAGLSTLHDPAFDHVGGGRAGARRRRPAHRVREAGLRDPALVGDLRAAWARGRGAHARRHRLASRTPRRPGTQGRALHRLPVCHLRSERRSSTT